MRRQVALLLWAILIYCCWTTNVAIAGTTQWTPLSRIYGGDINMLAISPNFASDKTVFAATNAGGLCKSNDGGMTWSRVNDGSQVSSAQIWSVFISPNFETDKTVFTLLYGNGIFKSTDAGSTWTKINDPYNGIYDWITISPDYQNDHTIYVRNGDNGLNGASYKSTDGGITWSQCAIMPSNLSIDALAFSPNYAADKTVFAVHNGTGGGLFKSADRGVTWNLVNESTNIWRYRATDLVVSPNFASDQTLFIIGSGIQKSTDGGVTWVYSSSNITANAIAISPNYATDNTVYVGTAQSSNLRVGSFDGVFKSTDRGTTWVAVNDNLTSKEITSLVISATFATDQTVFVGTVGDGVFKSTSAGGGWVPVNNGIAGVAITPLVVSPNFTSDKTMFFGTGSSGIFRSLDGGANWSTVNKGLTDIYLRRGGNSNLAASVTISPTYAIDHTVFANTPGVGIFKSNDSGASWNLINSSITGSNIMAISPNFASDQTIFLGGWDLSSIIYKSVDSGASWIASDTGTRQYFTSIVVSPAYSSDHTIFAGTYRSGIFKSTDAGTTWYSSNTGITFYPFGTDSQYLQVQSLIISPSYGSDKTIFAVIYDTNYRLITYKSTDGGATWKSLNTGFMSFGVIAVSPNFAVDKTVYGVENGFYVYAVGINGLYKSTDSGVSWVKVNDEAGSYFRLSPNYTDDNAAFAIMSNGVVGRLTETPQLLTVNKSGSGNGSITTDKSALIWSGSSGTANYAIATLVTLTATPSTGSIFSGWSGDCTGVGPCTLTMDAAKTVTAAFDVPAVLLLDPNSIRYSSQSSGVISFSDNKTATFQCQFDGGAFVACTSPFSYSNLSNGQHSLTIVATNTAGKSSPPVTYTWTVNPNVTSNSTILLPRTGQTSSYASGDDPAILAGVVWPNPRFRDNGDQSISDNLTGLVWAKDANLMATRDHRFDSDGTVGDGAVSWQHALDYVKKLNQEAYLGYNDWRLPNRSELVTLVNHGQTNSMDWLTGQGFINVKPGYWTSTTYPGKPDNAWIVSIPIGYEDYNTKSTNVNVWPVRGGDNSSIGASNGSLPVTGQAICYDTSGSQISCAGTGQDGDLQHGVAWLTPRFRSNGDQIITDSLTGLIWSKDANPANATQTWWQALDYIKALNAQNWEGYNDWRLPNINELSSLINVGQVSPSTWLVAQGFINVKDSMTTDRSDRYWSSTTNAYYPESAWHVYMYNGGASSDNKTFSYYAWPVRGGSIQAVPLNGACGGSNGQSLSSAPSTNLCSVGTVSVISGSGPWNWTCQGTNGGSNASCSANKAASAIYGSCGTSNGVTFFVVPTSNLCASGAASTVSGIGPWNWNCAGSNGGTSAYCSASKAASPTTPVVTPNRPTVDFSGLKSGNSFTIYRSEGGKTATTVYSGPQTSFSDSSSLKPNTIYQYTVSSDTDQTPTEFMTIRTPLYNGWNVVGIPYNTAGVSANSFFSSSIGSVYQWIPTAANMESDTTQNGSYSTVTTLVPTTGYFVKAANASTLLTYVGNTMTLPINVTLKPGWTLITNPVSGNLTNIGTRWQIDGQPLSTSVTKGTIGGSLYWWNGTTYDFWSISSNPSIEPWKAYWIVNQTSSNHSLTIQ